MNKAMTIKDGSSSKAKLGHTKDGGIKIEYTLPQRLNDLIRKTAMAR